MVNISFVMPKQKTLKIVLLSAFLITKQFPHSEETIVAVASLLKNLTVTGGVRKLMIHDKMPSPKSG